MKMGNPCKWRRGEEGDIRVWVPQACSGDLGSSTLLGAFWGAVSPGLTAGPGSRACWKGRLQSLCQVSLEMHGFGAAWERGGTQLGRRDQLFLLLYKTCKVHPSTSTRT